MSKELVYLQVSLYEGPALTTEEKKAFKDLWHDPLRAFLKS